MGCGASATEQTTTTVEVGQKKYTCDTGWRLKLRPEEVSEAGVIIATVGDDGMYRVAGNENSGVVSNEPAVEVGMKVEMTIDFWFCLPSELANEDAGELSCSAKSLQVTALGCCALECEGNVDYKAYKYCKRSSRFTVGNPGSQKQLSTALADNVAKLGWRTPGGDTRGTVVLAAADKAWQHSDPPVHGKELPTEGFHLFNITGLVRLKDTPAPTPEKGQKAQGMSAEAILALKQNKNKR